jgi:hypothetical protein
LITFLLEKSEILMIGDEAAEISAASSAFGICALHLQTGGTGSPFGNGQNFCEPALPHRGHAGSRFN